MDYAEAEKMKIIKFILGIQACILGVLFIVWMIGAVALLGMDLDFRAHEYDYLMEIETDEQP